MSRRRLGHIPGSGWVYLGDLAVVFGSCSIFVDLLLPLSCPCLWPLPLSCLVLSCLVLSGSINLILSFFLDAVVWKTFMQKSWHPFFPVRRYVVQRGRPRQGDVGPALVSLRTHQSGKREAPSSSFSLIGRENIRKINEKQGTSGLYSR